MRRRALDALGARRRNANRDVLPAAVWTLIDRERGETPWAISRGGSASPRLELPPRQAWREPERLARIAGALDSERLARLADSAVYWDCITEIRYAGDEQVYDLTIPETHNFVANDICVHNTSLALNVAQSRRHSPEQAGRHLLAGDERAGAGAAHPPSEAEVSSRACAGPSRPRLGPHPSRGAPHRRTPLFIDDSPNPTLLEVASKARRLKLERGLELFILDYLQLMQAGGRYENRNLEIAAISRGLKGLAKELEIPVIALSQLSRQPERRGADHRPQLADLRESGLRLHGNADSAVGSGARVPIRELAGASGFPVWALNPDTHEARGRHRSKAPATGKKPVLRLATRLGQGDSSDGES